MADFFIVWFQSLCQEFNRNPVITTKTIEEFRDSDNAIDSVLLLLQSQNNSPVTVFHALSILQYCYINRYHRLPINIREHTKVIVTNLLHSLLLQQQQQQEHSYLLNKVIQVHVSINKRGWLDKNSYNNNEKQQFLHSIRELLTNMNSVRAGSMMLRITLEEFAIKSFVESNLPFEFHRSAKLIFEKSCLTDCFFMTFSTLSMTINQFIRVNSNDNSACNSPINRTIDTGGNSINNSVSNDEMMNIVTVLEELLKLSVLLISWKFDDGTNSSQLVDIDETTTNLKQLPIEWATVLLQQSLIEKIFSCHQVLRQLYLSTNQNGKIISTIAEIRNFILCLCSINGNIFDSVSVDSSVSNSISNSVSNSVSNSINNSVSNILSNSDNNNNNENHRIFYVENILKHAVQLLSSTITRPDSYGELSLSAVDYRNGGIREQEFLLYVNIISRIISNFKLSLLVRLQSFEQVMMSLGALTFELSKELQVIGKDILEKTTTLAITGSNIDLIKFRSSSFTTLLQSWRSDILTLCLDSWCVILDDNLLMHLLSGSHSNYNNNGNSCTAFSSWLVDIANQVFKQLFDCMLHVYETVLPGEEDEEEDEEEGLIDSRSTEDLLIGICTIGRVAFVSSLQVVGGALSIIIAESNNFVATNNTNSVSSLWFEKQLEKTRLCISFFSYLFIDDFTENPTDTSRDSPVIPPLILVAMRNEPAALPMAYEVVNFVGKLLMMQIEILISDNHSSKELLSPLILSMLFRFFYEYIGRYMDPDLELYSDEVLQSTPQIRLINGEDFNNVLVMLMDCSTQVLLHLPFENELVEQVSKLLLVIASTKNKTRLIKLVNTPSVLSVAAAINNGSMNNSQVSRLNPQSLSSLSASISSLFAAADSQQHFQELCTNIFEAVKMSATIKNNVLFEKSLSRLRGIARCNCGQFPIILGLFGASLPILKEPLVNYTTEDDIMMLYLSLLKDFAENHLSRLTDQICVLLYNVSYSVLQHCYNLFHSIHYGSETTKNTDNLSNRRVDLSIAILELLNSLAAKDFLFSDEASYEFLGNLQNEVSTVLLFGLQSILEIITMDMIRSLPLLAEKFYSFVAFLCSTYSNSVVQWVNSSASNSMSHEVLLNKFLSYLLLGMQVVDGITSRQALQALQSLGTSQWNATRKPNPNTLGFNPQDQVILVSTVLNKVLELVLLTNTSSFKNNNDVNSSKQLVTGILWDRMDSLANTIAIYIALEKQQFQYISEVFINRQSDPDVKNTLIRNFQQLVSHGNYDMENINRNNRQIFVRNFREFMTQIKSLSLK